MFKKHLPLIIAVLLIVGIVVYIESGKPASDSADSEIKLNTEARAEIVAEKANKYQKAKEISTPDGFINTPEITIQELIGKKVILVDFWTYSCINCQRTLPYLNAWHQKYKDQGLTIIGVHTPEFAFEEKYENVVDAVQRFEVKHPVVLDNDFSTWNAYQNRYWPRKYLIDIDGFIVYDRIGEGGYEKTEEEIKKALAERMEALGEQADFGKEIVKPKNIEKVDSSQPRSPEIYFGAFRNSRLGNGMPGRIGLQMLKEPNFLIKDSLYLEGDWNFEEEFTENKTRDAKIIFSYQAKKVFFVASSDNGVNIKVFKDGKLVKTLKIKDSQLYRLIEDQEWGEHVLEIEIEDKGLKAFTFTFG